MRLSPFSIGHLPLKGFDQAFARCLIKNLTSHGQGSGETDRPFLFQGTPTELSLVFAVLALDAHFFPSLRLG